MKYIRCLLYSIILSGIIVSTTSCLLGYRGGVVRHQQKTTMKKAVVSSKNACRLLKYRFDSEEEDRLRNRVIIKSFDSRGDIIEVQCVQINLETIEIRIRVGAFGDNQRSQELMNQIKKAL